MAQPPRPAALRRRLAWVTVVPLGVFGGVMGALAISPMLRLRNIREPFIGPVVVVPVPAWELVAYGIVTASMTMAALHIALDGRDDVAPRTWKLCLLFGWLNCPACLLVWVMIDRAAAEPLEVVVGVVTAIVSGLVVGLVIALPIGFLYGIALLPVMRTVGALREAPTLDAVPRAVRRIALTIAPLAVFGALCAFLSESAVHAAVPASVPLLCGVVALVALGVAEARIRRTRAFIGRVADGVEPRWALLPATAAALPELAVIPDDPGRPAGASVLVFLPESSPTYRAQEKRVLWAASRERGE